MVLFSPKARRLLDGAVELLPDLSQRDLWRRWAAAHPQVRYPGGPAYDNKTALPEHIFAIASAALDALEAQLVAQKPATSEHEVFFIDNDISLIKSIRVMLDEAQRVHA